MTKDGEVRSKKGWREIVHLGSRGGHMVSISSIKIIAGRPVAASEAA